MADRRRNLKFDNNKKSGDLSPDFFDKISVKINLEIIIEFKYQAICDDN